VGDSGRWPRPASLVVLGPLHLETSVQRVSVSASSRVFLRAPPVTWHKRAAFVEQIAIRLELQPIECDVQRQGQLLDSAPLTNRGPGDRWQNSYGQHFL
jgi:hypothetical protein